LDHWFLGKFSFSSSVYMLIVNHLSDV
jgi:hypothetical protein